MRYVFITLAGLWVVCGVFAYAIVYADLQRRFPELAHADRAVDRRIAVLAALFGPAGLGSALVMSEAARFGLKWR